jgi:hypothetical protein
MFALEARFGIKFLEAPMRYSLFPFPSMNDDGGPDVCAQLRLRPRKTAAGLSNLALLETTAELLRDVPWRIQVDHCVEDGGDLQLAVVAADLGRDVDKGDEVKAGFFLRNSESSSTEAFACERVYRVVCENGAILECEKGQTTVIATHRDWKGDLAQVIDRSFAGEGLDRDVARFRAAREQLLLTPYELLCNLVAQRLISGEEQSEIQAEFDDAGDYTHYGIINAITRIAGRLRDFDDWIRSMQLERRGGEVLRGDHGSPALDPVYQ